MKCWKVSVKILREWKGLVVSPINLGGRVDKMHHFFSYEKRPLNMQPRVWLWCQLKSGLIDWFLKFVRRQHHLETSISISLKKLTTWLPFHLTLNSLHQLALIKILHKILHSIKDFNFTHFVGKTNILIPEPMRPRLLKTFADT